MLKDDRWSIIFFISIHFGWILSFPLWGPGLSLITSGLQYDQFFLGLLFVSAKAITFLFSARISWMSVLLNNVHWCIYGITLTTVMAFIVPGSLYFLLPVSGVCSAIMVITGFRLLVDRILPVDRGRMIAVCMLLSNALLYGLIQVIPIAPVSSVFMWLMILTIAPTFFKIWEIKADIFNLSDDKTPEFLSHLLTYKWFFVYVALFFGAGSILSQKLFTGIIDSPLSIVEQHSLLPYMLALIVFSIVRHQVKFFSFLSCSVLIGIGLVIRFSGDGYITHVLAATLTMTAIASADLFLWQFLAQRNKTLATDLFCTVIPMQLLSISLFSGVTNYMSTGEHTLVLGIVLVFLTIIPLYLTFSAQKIKESQYNKALQILSAQLTQREAELLNLLITGISNDEIAEKMYISVPTVRSHLKNLYRKTGFANRNEILVWLLSFQRKDHRSNI